MLILFIPRLLINPSLCPFSCLQLSRLEKPLFSSWFRKVAVHVTSKDSCKDTKIKKLLALPAVSLVFLKLCKYTLM